MDSPTTDVTNANNLTRQSDQKVPSLYGAGDIPEICIRCCTCGVSSNWIAADLHSSIRWHRRWNEFFDCGKTKADFLWGSVTECESVVCWNTAGRMAHFRCNRMISDSLVIFFFLFNPNVLAARPAKCWWQVVRRAIEMRMHWMWQSWLPILIWHRNSRMTNISKLERHIEERAVSDWLEARRSCHERIYPTDIGSISSHVKRFRLTNKPTPNGSNCSRGHHF